MSKLEEILYTIALKYPQELTNIQLADVKRTAFHLNLVTSQLDTNKTVCDLGGGVGLFSVACAALGMKSILVDDFQDHVNLQFGKSIFDLHHAYGVKIISRDLITEGIDFSPESIDVFTSFDSMEHWHHSPKKLFAKVMQTLTPGGLFILGLPNCVNLRKRITVPLGFGKWSAMEDWYESDVFRGHVREPDVDDLRYIARDLGLINVKIYGRNWLGYISPNRVIKWASTVADRLIQINPALCSNIYVVGNKPEH